MDSKIELEEFIKRLQEIHNRMKKEMKEELPPNIILIEFEKKV